MDIHQSRQVIWHAAWVLDQGEWGTHESSMAKVICSEGDLAGGRPQHAGSSAGSA